MSFYRLIGVFRYDYVNMVIMFKICVYFWEIFYKNKKVFILCLYKYRLVLMFLGVGGIFESCVIF